MDVYLRFYLSDSFFIPWTDPYLAACYPNVEQGTNKGVILEIRRERTIELVMEGLRQGILVSP